MYKMIRVAPAHTKSAPSTAGSSGAAAGVKVEAVLEQQPKWVLLRQVAEEIQLQRGLLASRRAGGCPSNAATEAASPQKKRARTEGDDDDSAPLRAPARPESRSLAGGADKGGASCSKAHSGGEGQCGVIDLSIDDSPPPGSCMGNAAAAGEGVVPPYMLI